MSVASFLTRAVLLVAGLVVAASVLVVSFLLVVAWALRSVVARLAGRPVAPFVVRVDPRAAFGRMQRRAAAESETVRREQRPLADVTDVEPKPPRARD